MPIFTIEQLFIAAQFAAPPVCNEPSWQAIRLALNVCLGI